MEWRQDVQTWEESTHSPTSDKIESDEVHPAGEIMPKDGKPVVIRGVPSESAGAFRD